MTAFYRRVDKASVADLQAAFEPLVAEGTQLLTAEGYPEARNRDVKLFADVKYAGQTSPLPVALPPLPLPADTLEQMRARFDEEHRRTFGYVTVGEPLQLVSIKAVCRGVLDTPRMPDSLTRGRNAEKEMVPRDAYFGPEHGWMRTPVMNRESLREEPLPGPAIVEEYDTTTVVRPGWTVRRDPANNIVIQRGRA